MKARRVWIVGPDDASVRSFVDEVRTLAEYLLAVDRDEGMALTATARAVALILGEDDDPE